jgi:uncharacterized protein (DUF488 family)
MANAAMLNPTLTVHTIGHSNHSFSRFLSLLQAPQIEVVVDVRSHPASRFSPHFSRKRLQAALAEARIQYLFSGAELGGRPKSPDCYDEAGKVDYGRIEQQEFYQRGIQQLLGLLPQHRVCLLCAEENPATCHRRLLVAKTLLRHGVQVHHLRGSGAIELEASTYEEQRQLALDRVL